MQQQWEAPEQQGQAGGAQQYPPLYAVPPFVPYGYPPQMQMQMTHTQMVAPGGVHMQHMQHMQQMPPGMMQPMPQMPHVASPALAPMPTPLAAIRPSPTKAASRQTPSYAGAAKLSSGGGGEGGTVSDKGDRFPPVPTGEQQQVPLIPDGVITQKQIGQLYCQMSEHVQLLCQTAVLARRAPSWDGHPQVFDACVGVVGGGLSESAADHVLVRGRKGGSRVTP